MFVPLWQFSGFRLSTCCQQVLFSCNQTLQKTVSLSDSSDDGEVTSILLSVEKLKNLGADEWAQLYSGQYQGDMLMTPEEIREYETGRSSKVALIASRYTWAGAVVPYSIVERDFSELEVSFCQMPHSSSIAPEQISTSIWE